MDIIQKRRAGQYGFKLDGTNDYFILGADLTGITASKTGTLSTLIRMDGKDGVNNRIIANDSVRFLITRTGTNKFRIIGRNSAHTIVLDMTSLSTYVISSVYINFMVSWNLAIPAAHLWIADTDDEDTGVTTKTLDGIIDYPSVDWAIGASTAGTLALEGALSEFYFSTDYIDISVEANRRRFIKANGKPAQLGGNGERPNGNQPLLYLPKRFNEAHINKGSNGNFTPVGAPEYVKGSLHG